MTTKKLLLLLVAIIASQMATLAESLNEEQARMAAAAFFSPTTHRANIRAKARQLVLRTEGHQDGYYIFDRPEGGCVFVADDDAIGRTVLGYTDQGSFDALDLPIGLQDWLSQIGVLMDAVHQGKINRQPKSAGTRRAIVNKLIKTTWNQGSPYNNLCPTVGMETCVTGCVATAMAQVMKYWEWPVHGYNSIEYYDEGCKQTLSRDFTKSVYDWENMLDSYKGVYRKVYSDAVATLMRDCGYAVQMNYTPEGSAASVSAEEMAMYFHYSTGAIDRYSGDYSEEVWHELIRRDLDARRPVLYAGQSTSGGHEFILDGYDTEDYYHVNWGWGGKDDGWFTITNLNSYNDEQLMINDLEPDRNEESDFTYNLSEDGVLTISGTGSMPLEYKISTAPWAGMCQSVRKIVFEEGITGIVNGFGYAYENENRFSNLQEIVLPEGLQHIGRYAFLYPNISSINLPSTLLDVDYSFYGAPIESIHLPKNMLTFYDYLPNLRELTVDAENPWLCAIDNILYDKKGSTLLFVPENIDCITIAETTSKIIDTEIFRLGKPIICKGMVAPALSQYAIESPQKYFSNSGVLFIPEGADYGKWMQVLPPGWKVFTYADVNNIPDTSIKWALNDNVLTISGWGVMGDAYSYNLSPYYQSISQVQKLVVREGVISLPWAGFYGYSNLKEVILPSSLMEIDEYCFAFAGLETITCYAMTAPEVYDNKVFGAMPENGTLRIPVGADEASYQWGLPKGWKVEFFTPEPMITYNSPAGEIEGVKSLEEWKSLLEQQPNTIGLISPRYTGWDIMTRNMLIQDDAADGQYRCRNLKLADAMDFTAPAPFAVSMGTYSRTLQAGYNAVCLPFGISQEDLPQNCRMYGVSHYDADKNEVVICPTGSTSAGKACLIYCEAATEWQANISNKEAVAQTQRTAEDNIQGTFRTTGEYMGTGYVPDGAALVPLSEQLNPFRACILLGSATAPNEVKIRIADKDETDALNGIMADTPAASYSIDGKRLSAPIKGQPYIQNGKKLIIQ